jgi:hypothetical protein
VQAIEALGERPLGVRSLQSWSAAIGGRR